MKLLILTIVLGSTCISLVEPFMVTLAQTTIPSVFLNEQLWTGGIVTILAAFLIWQAWVRENFLRKETQAREVRMATRIDQLELQHADSIVKVVEAVGIINSMEKEVAHIREAMKANCAACDVRRDDIASMIKTIAPQRPG